LKYTALLMPFLLASFYLFSQVIEVCYPGKLSPGIYVIDITKAGNYLKKFIVWH
jgi:hypothetical protein